MLYVAPTRHLVAQVGAEVFARYSKTYHVPNLHMVGIFLPDRRFYLDSCQVLVTVPECAEMLLTSSAFAHIVPRIRYVIFDEVHNIVGQNGDVWEHALALVDAPFVALSATVGNPVEFAAWLQRLEKARKRDMPPAIVHTERFNDLKPFVWRSAFDYSKTPADEPEDYAIDSSLSLHSIDTGRLKLQRPELLHAAIKASGAGGAAGGGSSGAGGAGAGAGAGGHGGSAAAVAAATAAAARGQLMDVHPVGLLDIDDLLEHPDADVSGVEAGVELLPEHCVPLYDMLVEQVRRSAALRSSSFVGERLKELDPDAYFADSSRIGITEAHVYGRDLVKLVVDISRIDFSVGSFVVERLGSHMRQAFDSFAHAMRYVTPYKYLASEVYPLLCQLQDDDMLPCIVFHLEPATCERLLLSLTQLLVDLEHEHRMETGWYELLKKDQDQRVELDKAIAALEKNPKSKSRSKPEYQMLQDLTLKRANLRTEDDIDPKFAFVPPGGMPTISDLCNALMVPARYNTMPIVRRATKRHALMRGIACHHSAAGNKYRTGVEVLFRRRNLQVVFATSTLAQGIHMPCKTVVLLGDSPDLHAMTFRQMSGRAGRRGFDKRGNVVFAGIPEHKVQRLMNTGLPPLVGTKPMTTTMALRMMVRYRSPQSLDDATVVGGLQRMLDLPFISTMDPTAHLQQKHHLRFSLAFLRAMDMAAPSGDLLDMAYLPTYLFQHPGSYVFAVLLRMGLFARIVEQHKGDQAATDRALLSVTAFLFRREAIHTNALGMRRARLSTVVFGRKDIDPAASAIVDAYNKQVRTLYLQHVKAFVSSHRDVLKAGVLPVSNVEYASPPPPAATGVDSGVSGAGSAAVAASGLLAAARASSAPPAVRSPFLALRGVGDAFETVQEVTNEVCGGLTASSEQVPTIDETGELLNAYVMDFYTHSQAQLLEEDNGLDHVTLYRVLQQFKLLLQKIAVALTKRYQAALDSVDDAKQAAEAAAAAAAAAKSQLPQRGSVLGAGASAAPAPAADDDDFDWADNEDALEILKEMDPVAIAFCGLYNRFDKLFGTFHRTASLNTAR